MSEPPAVGPDRAALYEIARKAMDAAVVAVLNGDELIDPAKVTVDSILAALAASGAGPTEPLTHAATQLLSWWDSAGDDPIAGLEGFAAELDSRLSVLRAAVNQVNPAPAADDFTASLEVSGRTSRNVIAKASAAREQEPASDRWFTPQPMDAPPREDGL